MLALVPPAPPRHGASAPLYGAAFNNLASRPAVCYLQTAGLEAIN